MNTQLAAQAIAWKRYMLKRENSLPNWLIERSMGFFFISLFACWLAWGHVPQYDLIFTSIISIVLFFFIGRSMSNRFSLLGEKKFLRSVFTVGLVVRILWVLYMFFVFNPRYYSSRHGDGADTDWFMAFGKNLSEWISGNSMHSLAEIIDINMSAIDDAVENLPYVDKDRLVAVGASFGGFSVYYLAGHHEGRFKCFIAHDGAFNLEAMYTETEENWFSNWEYDDAYWNKDQTERARRTYENSPHRFVDKWDTPILCIHGEKDYRINATQGMSAFNAARMRGIEAQLLIFPDENHWVLKPQNGILWQRTYFAWLDKWLNTASDSSLGAENRE